MVLNEFKIIKFILKGQFAMGYHPKYKHGDILTQNSVSFCSDFGQGQQVSQKNAPLSHLANSICSDLQMSKPLSLPSFE